MGSTKESTQAQACPQLTGRGYYIFVTEACNLRCSYCFVRAKVNTRHLGQTMADNVLAFIKKDAADLKNVYIHFFGGEPLIRALTVEFLAREFRAWAAEKHIALRLGITTNGTLLTIANCEMLRQYDIGVQLSLDGSQEGNDVHRQVMGGSQAGMQLSGAFRLVKIGNYLTYFGRKRPNCRMTVTTQNLSYMAQSIRDLHAMGFKSFSIIPDADSGEWGRGRLAEYEGEMEKVLEYWASQHGDIEINAINQTIERLKRRQQIAHICRAGTTVLGITVDGDVYPCHDIAGRFSHDPAERAKLVMGNVETGLAAVPAMLQDLSAAGMMSEDGRDCSACWARYACRRGCPYTNYAHSANPRAVNATYCAMTRINATLAMRWMYASESYKLLDQREVESIKKKLATAVMNLTGGPDHAPFGRGKNGNALLPGPAHMERLGFNVFRPVRGAPRPQPVDRNMSEAGP